MTISKLLGATMIAGALATGGAVAGIAGAAASPQSTTGTTTDAASSTTTTPTTPPTNPTTPPSQSHKSGSEGKHPCPNMGSGPTGSSGYAPGAAPGVSYQ